MTIITAPPFGADPTAAWVTTVVATADGALRVRRVGADPEQRARLMRTARILSCADHPRAERLVALDDAGGRTVLVSTFVEGRRLSADHEHHGELQAACQSLLALLGELHARGVTHGPVERAQIRVRADGQVALCSFDAGHLRSELDEDAWRLQCRIDVATAVAALVAHATTAQSRAGSLRGRIARHRFDRSAKAALAGDTLKPLEPPDRTSNPGCGPAPFRSAVRHRVRVVLAATAAIASLAVGTTAHGGLTRRIPAAAPSTAGQVR